MLELFATALRVKTADASGGLDNYVGLPRHSDSHPLARLDFPTVLQVRADAHRGLDFPTVLQVHASARRRRVWARQRMAMAI